MCDVTSDNSIFIFFLSLRKNYETKGYTREKTKGRRSRATKHFKETFWEEKGEGEKKEEKEKMIYVHSRGEFLFSSSDENENYANKFSLILFSYTYEMRGSSARLRSLYTFHGLIGLNNSFHLETKRGDFTEWRKRPTPKLLPSSPLAPSSFFIHSIRQFSGEDRISLTRNVYSASERLMPRDSSWRGIVKTEANWKL